MHARGLSAVQVLQLTGVGRATLTRLRKTAAPKGVTLDVLDKLCGGLGVFPCALIQYEAAFGTEQRAGVCSLATPAADDQPAYLAALDRKIRARRVFEAEGGTPHRLRGEVERVLQELRHELTGERLPPDPSRVHPLAEVPEELPDGIER